MIDYGLGPSFIMLKAFRLRFKLGKSLVNSANIIETVHRQQLTFFPFRPSLQGLFTKIQTSIWSEFSGQKGMPCFASSLLDRNPRQRAPQILNGPIGQGDTYQPVTCLRLWQICAVALLYYCMTYRTDRPAKTKTNRCSCLQCMVATRNQQRLSSVHPCCLLLFYF